MKLDNLITQYLYHNKRVSLPGIGTFLTDGPAVKFENQYDAAISTDLIEFVKTHTGKMYSLAQSDLESYIMLNKQFLNIGKALHVEGIGTLVKNKEGLFDFTPGEMVAERMEDLTAESRKPSAFIDETRYHPESNSRQKWFVALLSILTLIIIVWGGWRLYVNNNAEVVPAKKDVPPVTDSTILPVSDSLKSTADTIHSFNSDSTKVTVNSASTTLATPQNSQWHYVIEETANKNRALRRYNQLKEIGDEIQMSTTDSITFKLYFTLPSMVGDTTRIKDSLRRFYGSRRVYVER